MATEITNGLDEYGVVHNHPATCFEDDHYYRGCAVHESHPRWWQAALFYPAFYGLAAGFYYGAYRLLVWVIS